MPASPEKTASTLPSLRFLTQPARPRRSASSSTHARSPTPCTRPMILTCTALSIVVPLSADAAKYTRRRSWRRDRQTAICQIEMEFPGRFGWTKPILQSLLEFQDHGVDRHHVPRLDIDPR